MSMIIKYLSYAEMNYGQQPNATSINRTLALIQTHSKPINKNEITSEISSNLHHAA